MHVMKRHLFLWPAFFPISTKKLKLFLAQKHKRKLKFSFLRDKLREVSMLITSMFVYSVWNKKYSCGQNFLLVSLSSLIFSLPGFFRVFDDEWSAVEPAWKTFRHFFVTWEKKNMEFSFFSFPERLIHLTICRRRNLFLSTA